MGDDARPLAGSGRDAQGATKVNPPEYVPADHRHGGLGPKLPKLPDWKPAVAGEGIFTPEECDRLAAFDGEMAPGEITGGAQEGANRCCEVGWIGLTDPRYQWVFQKAGEVARQVNQSIYRMELAGFTERPQVTRYGAGGFQNWHMDWGPGRFSVRKLTFIVMLSDPSDYEGGELEILAHYDPLAFPRTRGTIVFFPTFVLHRVRPVLSGTRMTLVGWIGGPHFR